jgi:hypothetical protein
MKTRFTDTYHVANKTFVIDGEQVSISIESTYDQHSGNPWVENDGHVGVHQVRGYPDSIGKSPGDKIIHFDHGTCWIVNIPDAIAKATREGWGCADSEGLTRKQIIAKAVDNDINYIQDWLNDRRWYERVFVYETGTDEDYDCLGGIENGYIEQSADYFMNAAIEFAHEHALTIVNERKEARYWQERGVMTA